MRTIFIGMDQHAEELKYSSVKGKNPFKDVRVRKALNMAVDREAIKRVVMRGLSIPAGIMVAPGVHGHSKDIDIVMKPDAAGAKKLLAEAGYPDGFEFTLDCPNNRYVNDEKICQALVGMWAKAGLRVKLNSIPFSNFIPKILNFDSSAYMLGWGVATFDAQYTLQSLVRTKTTGADGNFNHGRVRMRSSTPPSTRSRSRPIPRRATRCCAKAWSPRATSITTCRSTTSCGRGR